jgi:hypothetical protein
MEARERSFRLSFQDCPMTDHASACPAEVGKGERREAEPNIAQVDGSDVETAKSPRIGDCWEFPEENWLNARVSVGPVAVKIRSTSWGALEPENWSTAA